MKRRTLDIVFSFGGLALAGLLLILGLVMANQANFAETYVKDQLGQQKITFTPVVGLSPEEKKVACLTDNAGKALLTGKQAECYANEYIGLHVTEINDGKTYSQTSTEARAKKAEADAAKASGAANAGVLAGESAALTGKTDALFRGETLRGLLLTSYGFSIFGERAGQAGFVAFAAALVLLLASLAGFAHAFTKQADHEILSGK